MSQPHPYNPTTVATTRQLALVKKDQRWVFRYQPGEEQVVLQWLAATANDPNSRFDWFDAAVLSHQMGETMGSQLAALKEQATKQSG